MSTSSYEIRKAVLSDAEGIAHVHVKSWQTSYRSIIEQSFLDNISYEQRLKSRKEILKSKDTLQLVVTFEGEIVGFVNAGPLRPEVYNEQLSLSNDEAIKRGEIYAIYLLREHQQKGLGKILYQECRRWFKAQGYPHFVTWGLANNTRARRFYESEGGEMIGEVTIEIGDKNYLEYCYLFTV